ncbi:MAG: U32 family peptidase [Negativicutes bacterium]|nr:U32 family peptidase [Negativicutes bacterium]
MKRVELLAPAGSLAALQVAVAAGADAVYLGGKQFSARAYACNFDEKELEKAIRLAHHHGVRLYLTLNTLLRQEELAAALRYAEQVYLQGIDALIIQDTGLAALLRRQLPDLALHASTQMTIHNQSGIAWAAGHGFSRVILARELEISEISRLQEESPVGLEVFAHGALCFAYSGQCYMSSFLGGRSGNRGRCAQPCRLAYSCEGHSSYPLSTKDLCLLDRLKPLVDAGITAVKLEGRMKRPAYVATVVEQYRRALDQIYEQNAVTADPDGQEELLLAFNRGFSHGFTYEAANPLLINADYPANRGLELARWSAKQLGRGQPEHWRCQRPLANGDKFLLRCGDQQQTFESRRRYNVEEILPLPKLAALPAGQPLILAMIDSAALQAKAEAYFRQLEQPDRLRPLQVALHFSILPQQPVRVTIDCRDRQIKYTFADRLPQPAEKNALDLLKIQEAMAKLNDTTYVLKSCTAELAAAVWLPTSALNAMRRQIVDLLWYGRVREETAVVLPAVPRENFPQPKQTERQLRLRFQVANAAQAQALATCRPDAITLGGDSFFGSLTAEQLQQTAERCRRAGIALEFALPCILPDEEWPYWLPLLTEALALKLPVQIAQNAQAEVIGKIEADAVVNGDWPLQLMNTSAVEMLLRQVPCQELTVYPELSLRQAGDLCSQFPQVNWRYPVGGRQNLMTSKHCLTRNRHGSCLGCYKGAVHQPPPVWQLADRTGKAFPVYQSNFCRTHLLNSDELCLTEHYYQLEQTGFHQLVVDLRHLTGEVLQKAGEIWCRSVRDYNQDNRNWKEQGKLYRNQLATLLQCSITKGHSFHAVE